ncbi:MAG TPA: ABC transporter ATP-binding protein [Gemmatimonadaceae bacterium]|nr:ABC transporter ATP-binding protein [Gemmatimonadaceae bacterium]
MTDRDRPTNDPSAPRDDTTADGSSGDRGSAPQDRVSEGTGVGGQANEAGNMGPSTGGTGPASGSTAGRGGTNQAGARGRRAEPGRRVADHGVKPAPGRGEGQAPYRRAEDQLPKQRSAEVREAVRQELSTDRGMTGEHQGPAVIELDDVSLAFDEPILVDVSFAAHEGETIVVVGESGTGKSTALKLILRLLVPDSGQVLIDGQDIAHLSFDEALEVRQRMGMVFQGAALFDSMTVFENVAYPLREHTDLTEDEIEARVREKLEFVDLEPDRVMDQLPAELSGGMKKRVGIARGMANNPRIMLYDEPTSGLDPLTTGTITRLIMKLQRELGVTSIVVSHDIRSAFRMATRIALLAEKHIVFFGTPEEMAASENDYIRDFLGGF